tara:strand:+ start:636 stop:1427 length:792 start_codon:yes stop_codon:yes gene_type:complete
MNILDFETNFESAAKSFLATDLSSYSNLQFVSSLDQGNFTIPRVEINVELQGADDPPTLDQQDRFNYSQYSMNFILRIISDLSDSSTDASSGLTPAETHRAIRKKVRESMLISSDNFTTQDSTQILVTGAGTSIADGVYTQDAGSPTQYDKPSGTTYGRLRKLVGTETSEWQIFRADNSVSPPLISLYKTTNAPTNPTDSDAIWVADQGADPVPTVSIGPILADYSVKYIKPSGTDFEVDGDLGISTLTYEIKFCTRSSRWEV